MALHPQSFVRLRLDGAYRHSVGRTLLAVLLGLTTMMSINSANADNAGFYRSSPVASYTATPSFDCVAARLPAERAICDDAGLSRADARTAGLYGAVVKRASRVSDEAAIAHIRETQREFLRQRNACGWDRGCIEGEHRAIDRQLLEFMGQLD